MYSFFVGCSLLGLVAVSLAQDPTVLDLGSLSWTVSSHNVSVPGKIPSQAHLDLLAAGVINEPVYGDNDYQYQWIAYSNFTYTSAAITNLSRSSALTTTLVFEGLDTFAEVSFCNQTVGNVNNQFRKWTFDVSSLVARCSSSPIIKVAFKSAPLISGALEQKAYNSQGGACMACYGTEFQFPGRQFIRKEQNDYGWDWGPGFAPQGVWKPARLVQVPKAAGKVQVEGLFVDTYRLGQINNLIPTQSNPFVLNASVDYIGTLPNGTFMSGILTDLSGATFWQGQLGNVKQANQTITGSVQLTKEPQLWWPAGHGQQTFYKLTVTLVQPNSKTSTLASAQRRIGFRTLVLNQSPINFEQRLQGINGGDNWHFEINGHEIYAKGSNFVPPDPFWPRVTSNDVRILFSSAVAANQNMLRVWSSSVYMPDFVYDLADEYGLMLWSELQFSDAFHPQDDQFVDNIVVEVAQNVRRINHHPSLALWAGGNELQLALFLVLIFTPLQYLTAYENYMYLFQEKLIRAVFDNTRSISYIGGSTTLGYESFDYSRTRPFNERLPPNNKLMLNTYGDADSYNYDVTVSFKESTFDPLINSPLNSRFVNEFGIHSHSSYETYEAFFPPSQLSFNSSLMVHRNRHNSANISLSSFIHDGTTRPSINAADSRAGLGQMSYGSELYYPTPHKNNTSQLFKLQIYASQLFQAEMMRLQIDLYRRASGLPQRNLGSLYWMLGDIWAAPTWASIETGGRWKPLHHIAGDAYSSVVIVPFVDDITHEFSVQVTSDSWQNVAGTASLTWYDWSGKVLNVTSDWSFASRSVSVGAINSTKIFTNNLNVLPANLKTAVAVVRTNVSQSDHGATYSTERFFTPQYLSDSSTIQAFKNPGLSVSYSAGDNQFVVESKAIAAFVWLSQPLAAKGYFSKNGFWMLPGRTTVQFVPFTGTTPAPAGWQSNVTAISVWDLAN